jgi:5-methylcytosine-specific restriction protein A
VSLCSNCGGRKHGKTCPRCQRPPELRASAAERGYGRRWQIASRAFLARPENRICAICQRVAAECTDHIIPHGGDPVLFWDVANWQPACIRCNSRKGNKDGTSRTATQANGTEEV